MKSKTVSVRIDEKLLVEAIKLVKSGKFRSLSDLIREALRSFIFSEMYPWKDRGELRSYLKKRKFVESGKVIDSIREEEEL